MRNVETTVKTDISSLDIAGITKRAQQDACITGDLAALGSLEDYIGALQAMEKASKNTQGLPELKVNYDAAKHDSSLTVRLLSKGNDSWLSGGKLIYSLTYNPQKQTLKSWCPREK